MRVPASTYRIQVRPAFDLGRVAELADYLAALGADWVYLSPLLVAEPGSDHGYDVIDHRSVDPARGGSEGLEAASRAARAAGLGVLVDIVPNHMGVATPVLNAWWWDLLTHGRGSRHAEAFDVDWDAAAGRIRLPVLGSDEDVAALELVAAGDGWELRYYEHRFPVAPGTASAGDDPVDVHARQHYELVDWRRADHELNYRRFFAVNTLAAIRVEEPRVFDESHAEILRWIREGLADGLRVDHPDGLFHPGAYLDRLAEATGGAYVLVEKILEPGEELPAAWATAGTTGYDALGEIDRVLVDPAGEPGLDAVDAGLRGGPVPVWADLVHERKRAVADGILNSEVRRLDRALGDRIARDGLPGSAVAEAVAELLACFPVYRSYLPGGEEHLRHAVEEAVRRRPDLEAVIRDLHPVLADPSEPAAARFQQTSGMVMAKGVEDNAFYRYGRLTSLTEVGGDPSEFSLGPDDFHARQAARLSAWPASMTTLSTHDTKRGEDVRARLNVLAEIPEEWGELVRALAEAVPLGDGAFTNLLAQAIVGAWPAERERLHAYAEKAAREAGDSTGWADPDEAFEERMHAFVDAVLDEPGLRARVEAFVARVGDAGRSNGLAAKLLQLAAPGVPDVYQGSELWERSLVDPDNRRPVDFAARRELLARLDDGWLPEVDETGAAKLLVTSRALRLRRDRPELFRSYRPVRADGAAADHLVAFDRGGALALATRLPVGLAARGGWGDTSVRLEEPMRDVLTGRAYGPGAVALADVLDRYPVALLAAVDAQTDDAQTEEGNR